MPHVKATVANIIDAWDGPGPCDIACRLCGRKAVDDAPTEVWQGFRPGLDGDTRIDEHERCDAIASAMEAGDFDEKLDTFLDGIGVSHDDHQRARRVLLWKLGHPWPCRRT